MKTIIAGSRDLFNEAIDLLNKEAHGFGITEVVSGGATGSDKAGEVWANNNNVNVKLFPADWFKFGKSAGPIRNKEMADYVGKEGQLILIWDGKSRGSANMKMNAEKIGMKIVERVVE